MPNNTNMVIQDVDFSQSQIETIKETVAQGATNDELKLFLYQCSRTGLDPLSKQIHFIKRGGRATIQAGIDGLRAIAERTGKYAGNDDYIYNDMKTMYEMSSAGEMPTTATSKVYKIVDGVRVEFSATALWDAYCPQGKESFMWNKMPYLMLGKCAEALALRKAFPNDLSGIYSTDEMAQAGTPSNGGSSDTQGQQLKEKTASKAQDLKDKIEKAKVSPDMPENNNGLMSDEQKDEITALLDHPSCADVVEKVHAWLEIKSENHTHLAAEETIKKLKAKIQE
tara:strand:- start:6137 stop:6982 length:846 start_codon:yes stop_codon:yes gene_type:complete